MVPGAPRQDGDGAEEEAHVCGTRGRDGPDVVGAEGQHEGGCTHEEGVRVHARGQPQGNYGKPWEDPGEEGGLGGGHSYRPVSYTHLTLPTILLV